MATENVQYFRTDPLEVEIVNSIGSTKSYAMHNHTSMFTIGMILSGKIHIKIDGSDFCLEKEETFIVRPYEPHSIISLEAYDMVCLCINKASIEKHSTAELQTLASSILNNNFITKQQKTSLLHLISILKQLPQWNSEKQNSEMQLLKNNIELYPENSISIEEMSCKVSLSKYYFIKNFKHMFGLTPHQFQIQNRVRKAQRLIYKNPTMAEVALSAGFCDQSHLIKQFTKIVGLTPARYQKNCCHINLKAI